MLTMMAQVLVVEVFAEGTFDWGFRLLSNPAVSAAPEAAGTMIDHIRSDESPHVEYLRTALSEVRARTLRTVDGGTIAGRTVVDGMLHRMLSEMTRNRPREQRDDVRENLMVAMQSAKNPKALLEAFDALETAWTAPRVTGFEAGSPAEHAMEPVNLPRSRDALRAAVRCWRRSAARDSMLERHASIRPSRSDCCRARPSPWHAHRSPRPDERRRRCRPGRRGSA